MSTTNKSDDYFPRESEQTTKGEKKRFFPSSFQYFAKLLINGISARLNNQIVISWLKYTTYRVYLIGDRGIHPFLNSKISFKPIALLKSTFIKP